MFNAVDDDDDEWNEMPDCDSKNSPATDCGDDDDDEFKPTYSGVEGRKQWKRLAQDVQNEATPRPAGRMLDMCYDACVETTKNQRVVANMGNYHECMDNDDDDSCLSGVCKCSPPADLYLEYTNEYLYKDDDDSENNKDDDDEHYDLYYGHYDCESYESKGSAVNEYELYEWKECRYDK
jgi:hypothetical protein